MSEWQGRRIGPYLVQERLGRGGMGVVYRAVDTTLDRQVAIKMMVPAGDDAVVAEQTARFTLEAKAAARIQSRHVAQVIQYGKTETGELYIVMELLDGQPLDKLLLHGKVPPTRAVRIARHIAKGMQAAHDLGIVHRDLKPANVMLCTIDGEEDIAKVLDFGVAKMTNDATGGLTQQGALLGTLPFMAPEQVNGQAVDGRTDVYSLGVILFRMLAGAPMFDVESLSDLVRHQVSTPAPRIAERAVGKVDIPDALEAAVLKCLEKDPAKRFASMRALEAALASAMGDETSVSGPRRRSVEETLPTGFKVEMLASHDGPTELAQPKSEPSSSTLAGAPTRIAGAVNTSGPTALERRRPTSRWLPVAAGLMVVAAVGIGVGLLLVGRETPPVVAVPTAVLPATATLAPTTAAPRTAAATTEPSSPASAIEQPLVPAAAVVEAPPVEAPPAPATPSKTATKVKPKPKVKPAPKPTEAEPPTEPSGFVRVRTKEGG
ncbi:MAG: serine/threonine protein kinase [Deltaproteobacteria bacterium]|nr:serine/threonine protein kinase [Deltaproteobacteria bacterium]